jgi:hypothetical protein
MSSSNCFPPDREAVAFYRAAMNALLEARVPFLVGGAHALQRYAAITRSAKDFDIFVVPDDVPRALHVLETVADSTELKFPHWLAKAYRGPFVIDVIFSSGNGICVVDQEWFDHAPPFAVLDVPVRLVPVEEMIWQKAFIMERHRFDGNDVVHLLRACARTLNWNRLLSRFGANGIVLLVHLLLLRFAYPSSWSDEMTALAGRILGDLERQQESSSTSNGRPLCRGTLLSLLDYLSDVDEGGYHDARLVPYGRMTADEIAHWTATFDH